MSDIAGRINNLSAGKQALLLRRLQKKAEAQRAQCIIPRLPRITSAFPLSFAQQRFWFLEQLVPNSSFYNIPLVFRLQGNLRVQTIQPGGPYSLCGWSSGGVVAFEVARQLLNQNEPIGPLALLDSHAHLYFRPYELRAIDETEAMLQFIKGLLPQNGQHTLIALGGSRKETLFSALRQAKGAGVLLPDIELPDLRLLLESTHTSLSTLEKYTPEILPCQITLFRAREGPLDQPGDAALGWQQYTTEPVEIFEVPGRHYTMLKDPHVSLLAQLLQTCLRKSQQESVRKG